MGKSEIEPDNRLFRQRRGCALEKLRSSAGIAAMQGVLAKEQKRAAMLWLLRKDIAPQPGSLIKTASLCRRFRCALDFDAQTCPTRETRVRITKNPSCFDSMRGCKAEKLFRDIDRA